MQRNLLMLMAVMMSLVISGTPSWADEAHAEAQPAAAAEGEPGAAAEVAEPAEEAVEEAAPTLDMGKISYALGLDVAKNLSENFKEQGLTLNNDRLLAGLKAGLSGEGVEMTEEQVADAINELRQELFMRQMQQAQQTTQKEADTNIAAGKAFLAENAKKEGVVTTASGLQYKIIEKGEGASPKLGDTVTVNYHGTLIDGTVFDSSVKPPQPGRPAEPATFMLGEVIEGWNQGLTHVGKGGKLMLYIPSELAYRNNRMGPVIGPGSTLVFEVELIDIERGEEGDAPAEPAMP